MCSSGPALALGSWLAFDSAGKDASVMGDLVLTENEVATVMSSLRKGGISITALHNHVFQETPRILYMHIAAHGDAASIAQSVKAALSMTGTPAPLGTQQSQLDLDAATIEQALGHKGKVNGGVLQISVPRSESIREHGKRVPNAMGIATALNFQPLDRGRSAITGDFVLLAGEVQPVIDALTSHGISITALHSHMLDEEPRLFFLHFWAVDDAVMLARGLRAALEETNSVKAASK